MNENRFWQLIDEAWSASSDLQRFQTAVHATIGSRKERDAFLETQPVGETCIPGNELFIDSLRNALELLSQEDLLKFDRLMERKLFEIDRQDIHEFTDGSDDGFLYCRGFIVALGRKFYEAVNANPSNAFFDFECYEITYLSQELYEEKFGSMPPSDICRESFSNTGAWSDMD